MTGIVQFCSSKDTTETTAAFGITTDLVYDSPQLFSNIHPMSAQAKQVS